MIRDILCITAVGVGSALMGWALGVSHRCDDCIFVEEEINGLVERNQWYDQEDIISPEDFGVDTDEEPGKIMTMDEFVKDYKTYKNAAQAYNTSNNKRPDKSSETPHELIEVISYEKWCEDDEGEFDKDTLVYYEEDGIVCDMKDDTIRDFEELVGEHALKYFGIKSHDKDVVYIRNHSMKIDFEFIREHASYKKSVLGLSDEMIEEADIQVQEALEYFNARTVEDVDPSALAKYHTERKDE